MKSQDSRLLLLRGLLAHIELDTLNWEANRTEVSDDLMREQVFQALASNTWVVDSNYSLVRDIVAGLVLKLLS